MITIAHLSDPHIGASDRSLDRLRRTLDLASTTSPDLLVISGDIADRGLVREYDAFRAVLGPAPVVVCPGNHDLPDVLASTLGPELTRAREVGGVRVVPVDVVVPGEDHGSLREQECERVREQSEGADAVLLVMHHHPVPLGHAVADSMALTNPDLLDRLIDQIPSVAAVLVGHVHTAWVSSRSGRPVLGAPGIASALRADDRARPIADAAAAPGMALHVFDGAVHVRTTFHYAW
ncbi:metallophosphoesterase [Luteipulveratus halotolerans]|uniref:metallophosphoesterase n=1 Tax=Luteipulveratus halotolerans TaxID=1631356 RepID=UPI000682BD93|nr:metallophosphoesterase [Luteipulveratus halotolerans]